MDSCHLFNFLFGTKKATTELSRCFSNSMSGSPSTSAKKATNADDKYQSHQEPQAPPPSPLKQLQMKFVAFANKTTIKQQQQQQQRLQQKTTAQGEVAAPIESIANKKSQVVIEAKEKRVDFLASQTKQQVVSKLTSGNIREQSNFTPEIENQPGGCESDKTYRATLVHSIDDSDEIDETRSEILAKCFGDEVNNNLIRNINTEPKFLKVEVKLSNNNAGTSLDSKIASQQEVELTTATATSTRSSDNNFHLIVSPFGELISKASEDLDLQRQQQPRADEEIIGKEEQDEVITFIQTGTTITRQPRQLVLYDDECNQSEKVVSPSAQVYKFVTEICPRSQQDQQQQHHHNSTPASTSSHATRAHLSRIGQWKSSDDCGHLGQNSTDNDNGNQQRESSEVEQILRDKRRVRNIVQSFETSSRTSIETIDATSSSSSPRRNNCNNKSNQLHLSRGNTIDSSTPTKQRPHMVVDNINNAEVVAGDISHKKFKQITSIDINNNIPDNDITTRTNTNSNSIQNLNSSFKPTTIVKPLPPKTPPKSLKAKYLTWQLTQLATKAQKIDQLLQEDAFLIRLFDYLEPMDRCSAAQVCRKWREVLYSKRAYWKDLVSVIDCTQLRREQLVECIMSTLQSAKLKQQQKQLQLQANSNGNGNQSNGYSHPTTTTNVPAKMNRTTNNSTTTLSTAESSLTSGVVTLMSSTDRLTGDLELFDQDGVWRIQELCNRYTHRNNQVAYSATRVGQYQIPNCPISNQQQQLESSASQLGEPINGTMCQASKSSSIPSQISSTFSSVSLSSLLSPLSESSRIEFLREKLYNSLDERGFDAICLFGATDEDIEDLIGKLPSGAHGRISVARLNNCCITDRGLELFVSSFSQLEELELSGCNEISNGIELIKLTKLKSLIVTDCINIADGFAQRLAQIMDQLNGLKIQAYHLTDAFIEYLSLNADTSNLKRLELPDCKEITNQSLMVIAKHLSHLEALSLSGSTKICDDGIEILAERATRLRSLDLSWCTKITDASLECIACDLGNSLTHLILDRNVNITDAGLSYLATMSRLELLHIRWCPRITDIGLESILSIESLGYLSVAGLQQVTARSLMCLIELENLLEVELTNCQAVNVELQQFLSSRMQGCKVIF